MKVLVIGSGGREHALCWRLEHSLSVDKVYCVPGNAGIAAESSCIPGDIASSSEMACLAESLRADLTVVGPEAPLVRGIADEFRSRNLPIVGPIRGAARLEGSKVFAKQFMREHNVPTPAFEVVESEAEIREKVGRFGFPVALKADGLAGGKGVVIVQDEAEAREKSEALLRGELAGGAGRHIVVEQFLSGEEVSFIVLSDGKDFFEFPPTQDHKPVFDNDEGPNTGGMGAYCDPRILNRDLRNQILHSIVEPTLNGIREGGQSFAGFLYCGLMLTDDGPKVLEFNVRLGDPEAQPLMYRMTGDLGELLMSAAQGKLVRNSVAWNEGPTACVVCASLGYPGSYRKGRLISGIAEAEAQNAKVFHAGTRFQEGKLVSAGGRVLGVTAAGDDLVSAISNTYSAVEQIQFEGMHFRKDIGKKGLKYYA